MVDAVDTIKLLGSLLGNGALSKGSSSKVLTNVLGAALGGKSKSSGGADIANVLGGLLGGAAKQKQQNNPLGDVLGGLLGKKKQAAPKSPDMGDLLGGLLGGSNKSNGGLGDLIGAAVTQYTQSQNKKAPDTSSHHCEYLPQGADQRQALGQAEMLIRAMVNAAKSDGSIDKNEQEKLVSKLGEVSQAEADFVRAEFQAPLNVGEFAASVPRGAEQQVYAFSLMAIDLDTNKEAQYLHQLAQGLGISQDVSNQIHQQLGAQQLYS